MNMSSLANEPKDIFNEIRKQDMFMYYSNVFSGTDGHHHAGAAHMPPPPPSTHMLPHNHDAGITQLQSADLTLCTSCKLYVVRKRFHLHVCDSIVHTHLDAGYNEILDNRFQPGPTKDIILSDPVIIAHGHRRYVLGIKKMSRNSDVRKSTMTDMRELARLVLKYRELHPDNANSTVKMMIKFSNLRGVIAAMKSLASKNGGEKSGLLMNLNALLKRVMKNLLATHLCQLSTEESDDLDKFIHDYNDQVPLVLANARMNTGRHSQKNQNGNNSKNIYFVHHMHGVDKRIVTKDYTREYMREMVPFLESCNGSQPDYLNKHMNSQGVDPISLEKHNKKVMRKADRDNKKAALNTCNTTLDFKVLKKIRNITWTHDDFTELIKLFPNFWEAAMTCETGPLPGKQEILDAIQHFTPECLADLTDQQQYLKIRIKLFNERKKRFRIVQETLKS